MKERYVIMYKKLKELAHEKGISIAQVERDCELSSGSLSKWNKSIPSALALKKVSDYFKVSINELLEELDLDKN